jgi:hypothetical protein
MTKPRWVPYPTDWKEVAIVEEEAQLDLFALATPTTVEYNKSEVDDERNSD